MQKDGNEKRKCQFDTADITMINNALTKSKRNKISKCILIKSETDCSIE